jgi:hypothetical protein
LIPCQKIIEKFLEVDVVSSNKCKIIYIYTEEKYFGQQVSLYKLRSYDAHFNLVAKIKLSKKRDDLVLHGENIFLLNKNENDEFYSLCMYNSKLEIVQKFGQANKSLPFYFASKIDFFFVSDQYFIINEPIKKKEEKVTIINRSNGLVETSFVIYDIFHRLRLYLDKFVLTFNRETRMLKSYNLKGHLLSEIVLDEKLRSASFYILNKELCFATNEKKFCIF